MLNECLYRKTIGERMDLANFVIGILYGTSFGIFLSVFIDSYFNKQFENERKQIDLKIKLLDKK